MPYRRSLIYAPLLSLAMLSAYAATNSVQNSGVYAIFDITVHDEQTYEQYRQSVKPVIENYGGTYVVRAGGRFVSDNPTSRLLQTGGDWNPDRIIVLHLDSEDQVSQFLSAAEYKEIVHLRTSSASTKFVMVNAYQPEE